MPRKHKQKNMQSEMVEVEADYLQVDNQIPGQNYVCLSFVSPEKLIAKKDTFYNYHYNQYRMKHYNNILQSYLDKLMEEANESDTVPLEKIISLRKLVKTEMENDIITYDKFISNIEDFRYREEEKLNEVFDKEHNFQTSVRGLKVRGVYDSKAEADARASYLQKNDSNFDVYVGQVGYWLPWDPSSTKIQNQEYLNDELNKLVKEYKLNEAKKDLFYQEQKQSRTKDALTLAERLRHKAAMQEQQAQLLNINTPEISETQQSVPLEELCNSTPKISVSDIDIQELMGTKDPWVQQKESTNNL